jgi:predicted MFS family arabinose efflux permease
MDKNKLIMLLGLAGFIVMADNWVVSPILPSISQNLYIDVGRAGLLITAYMIPSVFSRLFLDP